MTPECCASMVSTTARVQLWTPFRLMSITRSNCSSVMFFLAAVSPDLLERVPGQLGVDVADRDLCAIGGEFNGGGMSDAARSTG
jgi:hypothetical protein